MTNYKNLSLLIVGAGIFQTYAIKVAKSLGIKVCVIDMDKNAPGTAVADDFIPASTRNIDQAIEAACTFHKRHTLSGVFTCGTDVSYTVACIAKALKLPGIPPKVAKMASDKGLMRKALKKACIPVPEFLIVKTLKEALKASHKIKFPLVIKPVDNMGARGIRKISSIAELEIAWDKAYEFSSSKKIILEEYIPGKELSIDTIIDTNGKVHLITIADRYISCSPYFVEKGHTIPSNQDKAKLAAAFKMAKRGIKALGIPFGPSKFDMKLSPNGPVIGEMTARLSGGFHSQLTEPLATGMNSIKAAIDLSMGLPLDVTDITPKFHHGAAERSIYPAPGQVVEIKCLKKARNLKNIAEIILNVHKGDILYPVVSNIGKAGHVIGYGNNRKDAVKNTLKALNMIKIKTKKPETFF